MKLKSAHVSTCLFATAITIISIATIFTSCKKSKPEIKDNEKFVGTWHGTSTCTFVGMSGPADTFSITFNPGAASNALTLQVSVASDTSCITPVTINLTAGGNNLIMPTQTFIDGCGVATTFSGNGTLSDGTLSMALTMSLSLPGFPVTGTCNTVMTK